MLERGKRIAVEGDVLDKISDLPSNVIAQILDFLPVKDAARTCVLSTKWRYIWSSHPNIEIDCNTLVTKERENGPTPYNLSTPSNLSNIINKILLQHIGPILKFKLDFASFPSTNNFAFSFLDHWLLYLSRNGIRNLTLKFSSQVPYILPSLIFSSPELKVLNFTNCVFKSPNGNAKFRKLNRFYFQGVNFRSSQLTSALHTPELKCLFIVLCTEVCNFKICAPKLEKLIIYESGDVELISFDIFSFSELKLLAIANCIIKSPNERAKFCKLDTCSFYRVKFRSSQVASALNTPQLKYLILRLCTEVCNFKIRSPKLKKLVLNGSRDVDLVGFEMAEITIIAIFGECTFKEISLTKLFEKWRLISSMYAGGSCFKYLVADPQLERLQLMTIRLKHLILNNIDFGDLHQISCILYLLQSSTTLSRLEISAGVSKGDVTNNVSNHLNAAYNNYWIINNLEVVIIENACGSEYEMRFIKFLLSCSPKLKKMFVQERRMYGHQDATLKLSKNLMRFPRASTEAEIILDPNVKIAKLSPVGCFDT